MVGEKPGTSEKPGEVLEYNQCQEAVRRLNEYLSNELRPEEEATLQRHLSQCRGCFSKFHFEETLLRTIRSKAEQVRAPMSLREKILGLLSHPEPTHTRDSGGTT